MNIDKEREKRDFLIQNYSRLSKDLNSLIKTNLNIISSTLRSTFINKIEDWPRKVVLLRVCDWINQIKEQIDKMISEKLFLDFGGGSLSYNDPYLPLISLLPVSDCRHKIKKLNLKEIDNEKLTNLLKTKFIYLKIIEKCCKNVQKDYGSLIDNNLIDDINISDYFFTSKLDLKSGIIEFMGKKTKCKL